MSWINMLYQTYENNIAMAGKSGESVTLSVVAHMVVNAQLEIIIDSAGNFIKAAAVDKEDRKTLIPVTESSASRSSGTAPHALSDTLSYVAGDYADYISDKKLIQRCKSKIDAYSRNLENWKNSEFSHAKVAAVYQYIQKKCMMHDLIEGELIQLDENGMLSNEKIMGQPYEKVMVRFIVLTGNNEVSGRTWQDSTLLDCYTKYYLSRQSDIKNICFVTGEKATITNNHPKGILQSNYGAKLISANDTSNFTYRGRFLTADEACTVSYEASQKAHSALTWLAVKQGITIGVQDKRTFICWNPKGKKVPDINDSFAMEDEDVAVSYTQEEYKRKLYAAVNGYAKRLEPTDDIVVMGLDAATTGRLSITYYNELKASDFLKRLREWNETCCWFYTGFGLGKKIQSEVKNPSVTQIVQYAFGVEQEDGVRVNDKVLKEQSQRLYYCILDGVPLPWDIVHNIAIRASMPLAYKKWINYENVLSTACALISKYYNQKNVNEGGIKMELDLSNLDRSYLFGRLLAIAERIEKTAMEDTTRVTNAMRLQAAYVNHPMHTWKILEESLIPYYQKLTINAMEYYKKIITEIFNLFIDEDIASLNRSLDDIYLVGYYAQRSTFYQKKSE